MLTKRVKKLEGKIVNKEEKESGEEEDAWKAVSWGI